MKRVLFEIFLISSNNPKIAKGIHINGIQKFKNSEVIVPTQTNEMPPLVGIGILWELLLLGLSNKFLESKGIISFKEKEVNIKLIADNI